MASRAVLSKREAKAIYETAGGSGRDFITVLGKYIIIFMCVHVPDTGLHTEICWGWDSPKCFGEGENVLLCLQQAGGVPPPPQKNLMS